MSAEAIEYTAAPGARQLTLVPPRAPYAPVPLCGCGHEQDAHEHYRAGSDCAVCGSARCKRYRARTGRGARSSFRNRTSRSGR